LSQTKYNFILRPKSEGRFMIGQVKVGYRGKIYRTKPIEIVVLPKIKKESKKKYLVNTKKQSLGLVLFKFFGALTI